MVNSPQETQLDLIEGEWNPQLCRIEELIGRNRELLLQYREYDQNNSNPIVKFIIESNFNKYNNRIWNVMIAVNRLKIKTYYSYPISGIKYYDEILFQFPVGEVIRYKLKENILDLLQEDLGAIEQELVELNDTSKSNF